MRPARASGAGRRGAGAAAALLAGALVLGGCLGEAKRAEAPEVAPEPENRITLTLVHVPAARVGADAESGRRLEQAVSLASGVQGLEAAVFGGESIENDDARAAPDALERFASLAGILAAKRYAVLGERERTGAWPREEVLRALERKKLVPGRAATYAEAPKPGAKLVVVDVAADGAVSDDAARAAAEAVKAAKEPLVIVVADGPPLGGGLMELFRKEPRVKLLLFRGAAARVEDPPDGPASIATPDLDGGEPVFRVIEIDGARLRTRLVAVPSGEAREEREVTLRPTPRAAAPRPAK